MAMAALFHLLAHLRRYASQGRSKGKPCRRLRQGAMAGGLSLEILETRVVPSFVAPRSFDVGNNAQSVAVGDFDGDGTLDLAVANFGGNTGVSVLLGNGDGTFRPARNFAAGTNPISIAVGDFCADGKLDLAVADNAFLGGTPGVSILMGNGDGTFQPPRTYFAGTNPSSVTVGDFRGNGILDLAVTDETTNMVGVLLGNRDGTFQPVHSSAVGMKPVSVAAADFKGDGTLDLVVANQDSANVSVLLGNSDGTFQAARNFAAGTNPHSVAVGDFTGDGHPDLAVANYNFSTVGTVSVLLANGDGTFQAPVSYVTGELSPAGDYTASVAVADLKGDGALDLIVANKSFGGPVYVLLGNGDGTFQAAHNFTAGINAYGLALGDFNGDGHPDLAVTNLSSNQVTVLLGNGDGSFQAAPKVDAGLVPRSVAVGDFDGDGNPDLAVVGGNSDGSLTVLLGNGNGTFRLADTYAVGLSPFSVTVGDFNGDGNLDLAVSLASASNNLCVLLGNGDGTFQAPLIFDAGGSSWSVTAADFNGDGNLDLVVTNYGSNTITVLLGNGDGGFQPPRQFAAGRNPSSVAVGDFNGDGSLDLAVADRGDIFTGAGAGVSILLGNGDGSFQAPHTYAAGRDPWSVVVGDFVGNGVLDLAVADNATYEGTPGVSVLLGNGDGTFQAAHLFAAGVSPFGLAVGDFNNDGMLDLAVAGHGGTRVLLGNGDGSFQSPNFAYVTGYSTTAAIGDFNGDGLPGLAVSGASSVVILANDSIWNGGRAAAGGGRSPETLPGRPHTEPASLGLLVEDLMRIDYSTTLCVLPATTAPIVECSRPHFGVDPETGEIRSARASVSARNLPALVLNRHRTRGVTPWLMDRLFADRRDGDLLRDVWYNGLSKQC